MVKLETTTLFFLSEHTTLGGLAAADPPSLISLNMRPLGHDTCTVIIVLACTMIIVHACTVIIVHACTMIIVYACTMIIIHACIMIVVQVSCPTGLMFGEVKGGGSGWRSPPGKQGVWGGASPPMAGFDHK